MTAKHRPFIIFGLPRSRTAWLSVFLDVGEGAVGHDTGITCSTPEDFINRLSGPLDGTCETGAAFAWPLIHRAFPDARVAVVRRDTLDVCLSLSKFGLHDQFGEMASRAEHLRPISACHGVLTLQYADLETEDGCRRLWAHCLDQPWDRPWWEHLDGINIQVDMRRRLRLLAAHEAAILELKAEVARRLEHA